jgi:hypothetical protein
MPPYPKPVSQAQRAAMHAAAQGHSTIGIPKKVGAEFAKGDEGGKLPKHVQGEERGERKGDSERESVHFGPLAHLARYRR